MDVRFVDCRDREAYLAGHIPGAGARGSRVRADWRVGGGGRHPLPTPRSFARWASGAESGRGTLVVGYDSGNGWAPRLWWLLRHSATTTRR